MYNWPSYMYWIWAQIIRLLLLPVVLPVRMYDFIRGKYGYQGLHN